MVSDATMIREFRSLALLAIPASCIVLSIIAIVGGERTSIYAVFFALIFAASIPLMMSLEESVAMFTVGILIGVYAQLCYYVLFLLGIPIAIVAFFYFTTDGISAENEPLMILTYLLCFGGTQLYQRFAGRKN